MEADDKPIEELTGEELQREILRSLRRIEQSMRSTSESASTTAFETYKQARRGR